MNPRICIQESLTSKTVTPCPVSKLLEVMSSKKVKNICEQILQLSIDYPNGGSEYEEKKSRLKRKLPVITPHACAFKDNVRKNDNAVPSGLAMLDLDDIENPKLFLEEHLGSHADGCLSNGAYGEVGTASSEIGLPHPSLKGRSWATSDGEDGTASSESLAEEFFKANNIYLVHITASGHGLRLIAQRHKGESIAQAQTRLAQLLGTNTFDASTKDLARTSFVVPLDYVLYMDETGLEVSEELTTSVTQCTSRSHPGLNGLKVTPSSNQPGAPLPPYETAKGLVSLGTPENHADGCLSNGAYGEVGAASSENPALMRKPADDAMQMEDESKVESQKSKDEYKGLPYSAITEHLITLLGGTPEQGERNTFYFTLVRYMRYICDFNVDRIMQVLPDFGLSEPERKQVITSGVNRPRKSSLPDTLQRAIALAECEHGKSGNNKLNSITDLMEMNSHLPKLPKVLQLICKRLPAAYRPAMVIASLPILGTLATRVRFNYLDHQEHSFSFMSMITAPAATGKSFIRRPVNLLLTPIDEQDAVEREKEHEYKDKLLAAKNAKQQPENPHACPRNNGINVSIAKLLQLLTYADGKHLIGIGEEIDTLLKSEKAGVWSQKSDIYRLAFDNANYGQNYMSDNSFSANVPVYYNLLLTGTPNGMYRFFSDVEDGLVTRWAFAQLPDMFGADIPEFMPYTTKEENEIIRIARTLYDAKGKIYCPAVDDAISNWLQEKKQIAIANDSRAVDTLRRRAGVIGFRAGYLAALLNGSAKRTQIKKTKSGKRKGKSAKQVFSSKAKDAAAFATYIAEYVFRNQLALFGEKMEKASNEWLTAQERKGTVLGLLNKLPQTFTRTELMTLRAKEGKSTDVRVILSRWISNGFIKKESETTYSKIVSNCVK